MQRRTEGTCMHAYGADHPVIAVLVGDAQVVLVDGPDTPVHELNEAISPASEATLACKR